VKPVKLGVLYPRRPFCEEQRGISTAERAGAQVRPECSNDGTGRTARAGEGVRRRSSPRGGEGRRTQTETKERRRGTKSEKRKRESKPLNGRHLLEARQPKGGRKGEGYAKRTLSGRAKKTVSGKKKSRQNMARISEEFRKNLLDRRVEGQRRRLNWKKNDWRALQVSESGRFGESYNLVREESPESSC